MKIIPILVVLYLYDTPQEVAAACMKLGIDRPVAGCAVPKGTTCDVHVAMPQIGYEQDFNVIGHEYWHCPFPEFH